MNLVLAWVPYVLVAVVLVLSRLRQLPLGGWLNSVAIKWTDILGTGITGSSAPLYLPGAMLIFVVIITFFLHRMTAKELGDAVKESSKILLGAGFVLIFTIPMVRVYINSGINAAGYASMPLAMAQWVGVQCGPCLALLCPVYRGLGAFIAGSNTVSNLMFSLFQHGVAQNLLIAGSLVVSLQAVGAAAGNMFCIHNVVAASATVGLLGQEGITLRRTIIPTIYYCVLTGIIGLVAIYVFGYQDPLSAFIAARSGISWINQGGQSSLQAAAALDRHCDVGIIACASCRAQTVTKESDRMNQRDKSLDLFIHQAEAVSAIVTRVASAREALGLCRDLV